jgi:DNA-binding beta-propeller fold protein YncE
MRKGVKTGAHRVLPFAILPFAILLAASLSTLAAAPGVTHSYNLADFTGTVPFSHVGLSVDRPRGEVFVIDANTVSIFNASGMEDFRFEIDPVLHGSIVSLVPDTNGDLLGIGYANDGSGSWSLRRFSYRGEGRGTIEVQDLPPALQGILPSSLFLFRDSLYLVSRTQMLMAVVDRSGAFLRGADLGALIEVPEKERPTTMISGLSVDEDGAVLFTVPVLFRAFVLSPEGKVASFGKSGSAPGQFGIVSGIARDSHGRTFVADKLRSVVMIFDKDFGFVSEFGYLGLGVDNLVRPDQVALGQSDRLYVTQLYNRGVAVYSLAPDEGIEK